MKKRNNEGYVGTLWEEWRPVKDYEGLYEVSNEGRVRSLNYLHTGKTKVMKAVKGKTDYLLVNLWKDGKKKMYRVHRLVWEAFNGAIPAGMQINHLDENPVNNWLENLEVCTPRENCNYGTRNERLAKAKVNHPLRSKPVNQIDRLTGEVINTYPSVREAKRQTRINQSHIAECCKGKHSHAGGYVWRFA